MQPKHVVEEAEENKQFLETNTGIVLRLGRNRLLQNPSQLCHSFIQHFMA
jgi:hypothetical protein